MTAPSEKREDGHFWVRFYEGAPWQVVKFWTAKGKPPKRLMKGLDWGLPCEVERFDNKDYVVGQKIEEPSDAR